MRTYILLILTALVASCATHKLVEQGPEVEERVGKLPSLGTVATVPVGGTVFSQFRYLSKSGYRLTEQVNTRLRLGLVRASAGDFVVKSIADGQPAFCTELKAYIDRMAGPFKPACFLERGPAGVFTHVMAAPGPIFFETALERPVRYEASELVVPSTDAFRYELLFQGASNKTLRIAYREFKNDMARPAFYQDVTYELEALPMQVSFRTVRLEVLAAGNSGLTYRVLSGF